MTARLPFGVRDAQLVVRLTVDERDAVRRIAARSGITPSALVRRAIENYCGETGDGAEGDLTWARRVLRLRTAADRRLLREAKKKLAP